MNGHVLVAEGRGERADSAAETLRAAGADVTLVDEAQAALDAMCARPPDIIVAEVRWPRGSGFSILAAARRSNPGAPAILFTGQPSVGEAVRAMQEGAETYLSKPLGEDLLQAVRQGLERRVGLGR